MSESGSIPRFAVVGHPNKGKSSLVAMLAEDDSVPIAPESGTTTRAVHYPMRLNGEVIYELIDTPGFQRPRRALDWMQRHARTAAERPEAVRRFLARHRDDAEYQAECELLGPIAAGAGIIYVVDGAVPYGSEYEPEMEILRWSGRPSLAVINPIGARTHVDGWYDGLGQFFRIVREVDVLAAPLEQRLDLLSVFGELDSDWRLALGSAVSALRDERARARARSARIAAELIVDALSAVPERRLAPGEDPDVVRSELEDQYYAHIRELERHARDRVEQTYHHRALARCGPELAAVHEDLFEERTWRLFGLDRAVLAGLGVTGGGAAGLGVDAALGGASFLLGAAIGAIAGGAGAWLAADRLAQVERVSLPFGEQVLRIRAGASRNLPFVLLGRARLHHAIVSRRSHARREPLTVDERTESGALNPLSSHERRQLAGLFRRIANTQAESREVLAQRLADAVEILLE